MALPLNAEGVTNADAAPTSTTRRNANSFMFFGMEYLGVECAGGYRGVGVYIARTARDRKRSAPEGERVTLTRGSAGST